MLFFLRDREIQLLTTLLGMLDMSMISWCRCRMFIHTLMLYFWQIWLAFLNKICSILLKKTNKKIFFEKNILT